VSAALDVAAVIPARDALPFVLEATASALAQTLPPAEVIVVDDGTDDRTAAALGSRFADRVRLLRGRFGSAAAARNAGWRAARAPWIAFLDADDLWFPDKLACAARTLAAAPEAGWFFSDGAFRTLGGDLCASWLHAYAELPDPYVGRPVAALFEVNFVLTSSVLVRREALETLGGFDEGMSHAEDLDLWIRLARRWPAAATRRALVRYQHRSGGLSRQLEPRLHGDAALFHRLAGDAGLEAALRRSARRREATAHLKLALAALRAGDGAAARAHLGGTWAARSRRLEAAGAWLLSRAPAAWLARARRQRWATRAVVAPRMRLRRVTLRAERALPDGIAARRQP